MINNPRVRAFTLVEMAMIVFLLLLIATAVVPRLLAIQRARDLQDLEGRVARLPLEAKTIASQSQKPVRLRIAGGTLVMEQDAVDGSTGTLGQVSLGSALSVVSVQQNGQAADAGSWQWTVYPDGSAQEGGIEFQEGTRLKSLLLSAGGESLWVTGDLTEQPPAEWPAGRVALRGG